MPRPSRYRQDPLNPIQISLDTPPGSPSTLTLENFDEPFSSSSSFTPQKRQKTGHTTKSKRALFIKDPIPTFSDTFDSLTFDSGTNFIATNSEEHPSSNFDSGSDPFVNHTSLTLNSDFYHEFVEAVLVNAMPFYPISRDVFVTQGWDVKNGLSTVSIL